MDKFNKKLPPKIEKTDYFYPFFERILFRRISAKISVPLSETRIYPPLIVLLGLLIALFSLWLISRGAYYLSLIGGVVFLFSFILDCVDGEVARLKNQADKFGQFADAISDVIKESLLIFALAINYFVQTKDQSILFYFLPSLWLMLFAAYMIFKLQELQPFSASQVKKEYLASSRGPYHWAVLIFSNIYTPSFLYLLVFLALIFNQILPLFYFFIISKVILVAFLFKESFKLRGK